MTVTSAPSPALRAEQEVRSPWPARLALWTLWAAVPLVAFGGTVTTLRAGMAEDGWLKPDGYWLWLYPLAMRTRDVGTFVEHHHRELGSLVGFLCLLTAGVTLLRDVRSKAKLLATIALLAVIGQGVIGGFRVLENSPQLAFLHGAIGQLVFGILAMTAVYLSARYQDAKAIQWTSDPGLTTPTRTLAALLVFQAFVGAAFRHEHQQSELGQQAGFSIHALLGMHIVTALAILILVLAVAGRLKEAAGRSEVPDCAAAGLRRARAWLFGLLHAQVLLGVLATIGIFGASGGMGRGAGQLELVSATLHVIVGAGLLGAALAAALWAGRTPFRGAQEARA